MSELQSPESPPPLEFPLTPEPLTSPDSPYSTDSQPSSPSPTPELTDYESSSSLEIVVDPQKLREELDKEIEDEKEAAMQTGEQTYDDGTPVQRGADGKVRSARIVRLERIIRKRRAMKAQVVRYWYKHLEKPYVRKAYNYFRRDIPPENDLNSDLTRKLVSISADADRLCVKIVRRSPLPY